MSRTKTRRDGRREIFWRDAVRGQRGSGLSIRAFCRARRLSEASFYSWRRELRRRDEEQPEGETTRHEPTPIGPTPVERTPSDPTNVDPTPMEPSSVERPPRFAPVSLRQAAWRTAGRGEGRCDGEGGRGYREPLLGCVVTSFIIQISETCFRWMSGFWTGCGVGVLISGA